MQQDLGDLGGAASWVGVLRSSSAVAPRDAAPVLHRAAHVGHEDLVVLLLGERRAELLAEPRQALLGELEQLGGVAVEQGLERLAAVEAEVVVAAPLAQLVERAGVDHRDVRREARRVGEASRPARRRAGRRPTRVRGVAGTVQVSGALTVKPCTALRSGWSKLAQARRAMSGSKVVQR